MKIKILFFIISIFAVLSLSFQNVSADVKFCSSDADCGANAGCVCGSCICDPQWFDCDADSSNGCEHHYSCLDACTPITQTYCVDETGCAKGIWGVGQASDCSLRNRFFQACSAPTSKCYQSGSSASCVECLTDTDCNSPKKCRLSDHTCYLPQCTSCSDGTKCGDCSSINIGQFCKDVNGAGVPIDDENTCKGCVKYSVGGANIRDRYITCWCS